MATAVDGEKHKVEVPFNIQNSVRVPEDDLTSALDVVKNFLSEKQSELMNELLSLDRINDDDDDNYDVVRQEIVSDGEGNNYLKSDVKKRNLELMHDAYGKLCHSFSENIKRFVIPVPFVEYERILSFEAKKRGNTKHKDRNNEMEFSGTGRPFSYLDLLDTLDEDSFSTTATDAVVESDENDLDTTGIRIEVDDDVGETSSEVEDDSEEEEDEDDLKYLDKDAQSRVEDLRRQVQEKAGSLLQLQTEVSRLIAEETMKEFDVCKQQVKDFINSVDGNDEKTNKDDNAKASTNLFADDKDGVENNKSDDAAYCSDKTINEINNIGENMMTMQNSLEQLSTTLLSVEKEMKENFEGFKETVETIEESLYKKQMIESEKASMPAVESAILHTVNLEVMNQNDIIHSSDEKRNISPEKRFSLFVSKSV